jgi:hypothetical protein
VQNGLLICGGNQVNPRKTQKNQLYATEAERYAAKLLVKAETIVASANKIWGMYEDHHTRVNSY